LRTKKLEEVVVFLNHEGRTIQNIKRKETDLQTSETFICLPNLTFKAIQQNFINFNTPKKQKKYDYESKNN
jgi:hypothetical protein